MPEHNRQAQMSRERRVRVHFTLLMNLQTGDAFQLNLFEMTGYTALITGVKTLSTGERVLSGSLQERGAGQFVLVAREGRLTGSIREQQSVYHVRPLTDGDGAHLIEEVDTSKLPAESHPLQQRTFSPLSPTLRAPALLTTDAGAPVEITVLVGYTPAVRAAQGGPAAVHNLAQLLVEETNLSFENSGIAHRFRLAGSIETAYVETGLLDVDLTRLQRPADGFMDDMHAARESAVADLVVLLLRSGSHCGQAVGVMDEISAAFATNAFVVVRADCASGNYSFGHELGHLMGARHDWFTDATRSPSYNHGLVSLEGGWRTMMAYPNQCNAHGLSCPRVLYWSNPEMQLGGQPLGVTAGTSIDCTEGNLSNPPCDADNRKRIEETAFTVSRFRVEDPPRPQLLSISGLPAVIQPGTAFTVQIHAVNNGAAGPGWLAASVLYSDGSDHLALSASTPDGASVEVLPPGQGQVFSPACHSIGAAVDHQVKARWEVWETGAERTLSLTILPHQAGKLWLRFGAVLEGPAPCELYHAGALAGAISEPDAQGWASARVAVQVGPGRDAFEPDDPLHSASVLYAGQPQSRSLLPVGDLDSVRFTLKTTSGVRLETFGISDIDTFLILYNDQYQPMASDDDSGVGANALIERHCSRNPLPQGEYFAQVYEFGNDVTVDDYQLSLFTESCAEAFLSLVPSDQATVAQLPAHFSWQPSAGAVRYEICMDQVDDGVCTDGWRDIGLATDLQVSGLQAGATYFWLVRAVNASGVIETSSGWQTFSVAARPYRVYLSIVGGENH